MSDSVTGGYLIPERFHPVLEAMRWAHVLGSWIEYVRPSPLVISQEEARASAARFGRLVIVDNSEATYATATH